MASAMNLSWGTQVFYPPTATTLPDGSYLTVDPPKGRGKPKKGG